MAQTAKRAERRRGRSVAELRRQRVEMMREWERLNERGQDDNAPADLRSRDLGSVDGNSVLRASDERSSPDG